MILNKEKLVRINYYLIKQVAKFNWQFAIKQIKLIAMTFAGSTKPFIIILMLLRVININFGDIIDELREGKLFLKCFYLLKQIHGFLVNLVLFLHFFFVLQDYFICLVLFILISLLNYYNYYLFFLLFRFNIH